MEYDEKLERRPRSSSSRLLTNLSVALVTLLSLGILCVGFSSWTAQFSPSSHVSGSDGLPETSTQQQDNDYILDTNWDFDAEPQEREYHWIIQDAEHNPDGVYRPMILINEQFPGPLIECNDGDTLIVHVENKAVNATSIHWHGMYQNGTNWMDGTVGITQCPIAPGTSFTYKFQVSGQSGTYWYHGHQAIQASDGLVGPLIVHSKDELENQKVKYDTDRILMVSDHYYDLSSELLMEYLQPGKENAEPVPDHALINGKGIRDCDSLPNRKCDNSTAEIPTIDLAPDQKHRLRIINTGAFAEFQIQLDEHEFAVTEVDGTDVEPAYFHRLNISPAQRYSIVIHTNVTRVDSYWLRARMVTACFAEDNEEMEPEVRAIVRYGQPEKLKRHGGDHHDDHEDDEDDEDDDDDEEHGDNEGHSNGHDIALPESKDWPEVVELECRDMNLTELHPVVKIAAPSTADTSLYLRSNFEIGAWRLSRGFFNTSSWRAPIKSPSLHRVIDGFSSNNETFTTQNASNFINSDAFHSDREFVHQSSGIQTIDLVISNFDDGNHPLHLHGYKYFVLAQGHGYPPENYSETVDLSNPLRRDTASIEAYGWIIIRFVADNAGLWAFHCHVTWHAEAGLLMQFLTRTDEMQSWKLPEDNADLCQRKGIQRGKGPDDEIWFGNFG